jgi:putative methanogenesis marker protein 8
MTENIDEHIIEASGKCRIVVRNGEVVEVGKALIKSCPLTKKFACPVYDLDKESVKANFENRIKSWGMCTPERRVIEDCEFVGFGASEILSFGLSTGMLDAVVLACDGAGTLVAANPSLVQGIGGRMSGLVKTVPYEKVIRRIEEAGGVVIDRENASLNQLSGVAKAYERGYKNVAVTVAIPTEAEMIRKHYPEAIIFGVHVTGLNREEAETLVSVSDFVTSCASAAIREAAGEKALVQAGTAIPTFAVTRRAKDIILEKVRCRKEQLLIKTTKLPVVSENQPEPLI